MLFIHNLINVLEKASETNKLIRPRDIVIYLREASKLTREQEYLEECEKVINKDNKLYSTSTLEGRISDILIHFYRQGRDNDYLKALDEAMVEIAELTRLLLKQQIEVNRANTYSPNDLVDFATWMKDTDNNTAIISPETCYNKWIESKTN